MASGYRVTVTLEAHGQSITLSDTDTSGDNPAFVFHDTSVSLRNMQEQLEAIVPALMGVRQR